MAEAPFIVASNHGSLVDPPLVAMACKKYPIDFMAKKELFEHPLVGWWTRRVRCIEVRRGDNAVKSLKEAIRRLKAGHVVGLFPEGTRSADGTLQEAKRGTGFLVARSGVPIVPCYIDGSAKAFPKGQKIKWKTEITISIGKPILPEEFNFKTDAGKVDYEAISGFVMERIAELGPEASS